MVTDAGLVMGMVIGVLVVAAFVLAAFHDPTK